MSLFTSFKAKLECHHVVHFKTGWRFQPKNISQIGPFPHVGVKLRKNETTTQKIYFEAADALLVKLCPSS